MTKKPTTPSLASKRQKTPASKGSGGVDKKASAPLERIIKLAEFGMASDEPEQPEVLFAEIAGLARAMNYSRK